MRAAQVASTSNLFLVMVENDKLAILLEWFKDNKVSWDNTKIDVRAVDNGFGVFALKDCPENETRKSSIDLH